jgi:hypothetical protein
MKRGCARCTGRNGGEAGRRFFPALTSGSNRGGQQGACISRWTRPQIGFHKFRFAVPAGAGGGRPSPARREPPVKKAPGDGLAASSTSNGSIPSDPASPRPLSGTAWT